MEGFIHVHTVTSMFVKMLGTCEQKNVPSVLSTTSQDVLRSRTPFLHVSMTKCPDLIDVK